MAQTAESKYLPEKYLRLGLLFCPIAVVLFGAGVGAAAAALLNRPVHPLEMLVAAGISIIVGLFAVLPMAIMIGRGGVMLLRCATLANMARLVGVGIGGVVAVTVLPRDAHKMALILWLVGFYFLLLIGESVVSSWVMKHSRM